MRLFSWSALTSSGSGRTPTHRAIGRFLFLVVAVGALGGLGAVAGCSHDARPVQPQDPAAPPPALPPASGTPIGYLVEAGELKLSDDQVTKLKAIDDNLATQLMYVENMQRNAAEPPPKDDSRGRTGFGVSTANNTIAEGIETAPPPTISSSGTGGGSSSEDRAATLKRVPEVRASVVRTAIAHALAVLDAGQQKLARQLLKDRGVDPDTGRFEATGEPGAARGSAN
jgi:hypothetical protein